MKRNQLLKTLSAMAVVAAPALAITLTATSCGELPFGKNKVKFDGTEAEKSQECGLQGFATYKFSYAGDVGDKINISTNKTQLKVITGTVTIDASKKFEVKVQFKNPTWTSSTDFNFNFSYGKTAQVIQDFYIKINEPLPTTNHIQVVASQEQQEITTKTTTVTFPFVLDRALVTQESLKVIDYQIIEGTTPGVTIASFGQPTISNKNVSLSATIKKEGTELVQGDIVKFNLSFKSEVGGQETLNNSVSGLSILYNYTESEYKPIPENYLNIQNGALIGFKPGVDPSQLSAYNTLFVNKDIVEVSTKAFSGYENGQVLPNNITHIVFEEGTKILYIAAEAFANCSGVEELVLPNRTEFVDQAAFKYCSNLKTIDISSWGDRLQDASPFAEADIFVGCGTSTQAHELKLPTGYDLSAYLMLSGTGLDNSWFKVVPEYIEYGDGNYKFFEDKQTGELWFAGILDVNKAAVTSDGTYVVPKIFHKIAPNAFKGILGDLSYSKIKNIGFEEGSELTKICYGAFAGNTKLFKVDLSNCSKLRCIDVGAFQGMATSRLTDIVMPKDSSLTSLGAYAFYNEGSLVNVDLTDTKLVKLGVSAFAGCTKLQTLDLPKTTRWISAGAISGNTQLKSITIPQQVTYIGARAFKDCPNVSSVNFATSANAEPALQYIGAEAFLNCGTIESINIPKAVEYIGEGALNIPSLREIKVADGNADYRTEDNGTMLLTSDKKELIAITHESTWNFKDLTSLETIGSYAAANIPCRVKTIDLSETNLININSFAFRYLTSSSKGEVNIKLPTSVKLISNYAFANSDITDINIGDLDGPTLGHHLFYDCDKLEKVIIPNGVEIIPGNTFENCTNLTTVTIPNTVKKIEKQAFGFCSNINKIDLFDFDTVPTDLWKGVTSAFLRVGEYSTDRVLRVKPGTEAAWKALLSMMKLPNIDVEGGWTFETK